MIITYLERRHDVALDVEQDRQTLRQIDGRAATRVRHYRSPEGGSITDVIQLLHVAEDPVRKGHQAIVRKRVLAVPQGERLENGEENGLLRLLQWSNDNRKTSSNRLLMTVSITSNALSRLLGTARAASMNAFSLMALVNPYIYKARKRHQIGLLRPRHHVVGNLLHRIKQNGVVTFGYTIVHSLETRSPSVRFHNQFRVSQDQVAFSLRWERIGLCISTWKPKKVRKQRNRSISRALQQ